MFEKKFPEASPQLDRKLEINRIAVNFANAVMARGQAVYDLATQENNPTAQAVLAREGIMTAPFVAPQPAMTAPLRSTVEAPASVPREQVAVTPAPAPAETTPPVEAVDPGPVISDAEHEDSAARAHAARGFLTEHFDPTPEPASAPASLAQKTVWDTDDSVTFSVPDMPYSDREMTNA
jgi:hypothetical protein